MARRGGNSFKRNDAIRAIQSARDAGMEPNMMEVVVTTEDGTVTFRVYGEKSVGLMPASSELGIAKEWQDEIDKLKKKPDAT